MHCLDLEFIKLVKLLFKSVLSEREEGIYFSLNLSAFLNL